MSWQISDENGSPLDANFDAGNGFLILHSRGGTRGTPNARNTEYSLGLRLLLRRLKTSELRLQGIWVDSSRVQNIPMSERRILAPEEISKEPEELFTLISSRMAAVGRDRAARSGRGNSNKRIRFEFSDMPVRDEIVRAFGGLAAGKGAKYRDRLPVDQLTRVSPEFIWRAVQKLEAGYASEASEQGGGAMHGRLGVPHVTRTILHFSGPREEDKLLRDHVLSAVIRHVLSEALDASMNRNEVADRLAAMSQITLYRRIRKEILNLLEIERANLSKPKKIEMYNKVIRTIGKASGSDDRILDKMSFGIGLEGTNLTIEGGIVNAVTATFRPSRKALREIGRSGSASDYLRKLDRVFPELEIIK